MPVITISREYGSGGKEVARRVCEMLGYTYFDKNLMLRVAAEVGLSEEEVIDFSEDTYKMRNLLERIFDRRRMGSDAWESEPGASRPLQVEFLNEAQCVNLAKDTIIGAYKRDNVVILGRGGQAILRENAGVLHVRLTAPQGARALRVQARENIDLGEANALVRRRDNAADAYLKRFFDIDWEHPLLYHLIINTGKWDPEDAAEMIVHAMSHLHTVSSG